MNTDSSSTGLAGPMDVVNTSLCLGLRTDGQHENRNSLLVLVLHQFLMTM